MRNLYSKHAGVFWCPKYSGSKLVTFLSICSKVLIFSSEAGMSGSSIHLESRQILPSKASVLPARDLLSHHTLLWYQQRKDCYNSTSLDVPKQPFSPATYKRQSYSSTEVGSSKTAIIMAVAEFEAVNYFFRN